MAGYKRDRNYIREQLKMEKETLAIYDGLRMDKDCEQYQSTVNEIEKLESKLKKMNKFDFDDEEV